MSTCSIYILKTLFFSAPGPRGSNLVVTPVAAETSDYSSRSLRWRVEDTTTGRGYRIVAGSGDHKLVADTFDPKPFAAGDYWVLRESPAEIDDGVNFGSGCSAQLDDFVDGESVAGEDVVFWYRFGTHHVGMDECFCGQNGPRLEPIGDWSPAP